MHLRSPYLLICTCFFSVLVYITFFYPWLCCLILHWSSWLILLSPFTVCYNDIIVKGKGLLWSKMNASLMTSFPCLHLLHQNLQLDLFLKYTDIHVDGTLERCFVFLLSMLYCRKAYQFHFKKYVPCPPIHSWSLYLLDMDKFTLIEDKRRLFWVEKIKIIQSELDVTWLTQNQMYKTTELPCISQH